MQKLFYSICQPATMAADRSSQSSIGTLCAALISILLLLQADNSAAQTSSDNPNVIWILLDACRADHLSCYGYDRTTSQNIDEIAARGVLLERNYAQGPNTVLSVGSYMTGKFFPAGYTDPPKARISYPRIPPDDEKLISTILSENGYATAMFSASPWYSKKSRLGKSFDTFRRLAHSKKTMGNTYQERNPQLFDWLRSHSAKPFFLYVHSLDTHNPRFHNNTHTTWIDPSFPQPRDEELRAWGMRYAPFVGADQQHIKNLYDGGVSYADETIGELVAELKRLEVLENTIIIISSDHGEALAEDGRTLGHPGDQSYDDLLRTPLILAGPGIAKSVRISAKTQNADIVPTLTEILGFDTSEVKFDGTSFFPLLRDPGSSSHLEYAFARSLALGITMEPIKILIFDDVKYEISPHTVEEYRHMGITPRPQYQIWKMDDYSKNRIAIAPTDELRERADSILEEAILPRWKQTSALTTEPLTLFYVAHQFPVDKSAITKEASPVDNKWTHLQYHIPLKNSYFLIAYPWMEKPPEILFRPQVPNGTYAVSMYTLRPGTPTELRATSFSFKAEGESEFRTFRLEPNEKNITNDAWFDLGTYTITDGQFVYGLRTGHRNDLALMGDLRFVLKEKEGEVASEEELAEEREYLKSLGYVQ